MKRVKVQGRPAKEFAGWIVDDMGRTIVGHLRGRGNLSRDDLEYVVQKVEKLKDERLAQSIAELIAWGDDERAEVETFVAIALELMRNSKASAVQAAARTVEIKYLMAKHDLASCNPTTV
jgi:hypothetical protein